MHLPPRSRSLALALTCTLTAVGASTLAQDEEPPLRLTLEVAGKKIDVELGRAFEIEIGGQKVPMKLLAKPTRRFSAAGVEFDYPRHLSFEVDRGDPNVTMWSLHGDDVMIMVQKYARTDLRDLLNSIIDVTEEYYDDAEIEKTGRSISLAGIKSEGHRLSIAMDGTHLRQDYFPIQLRDASLVVMVQDTLDDDDSVLAEGKKTRDLLLKTFKIAQ